MNNPNELIAIADVLIEMLAEEARHMEKLIAQVEHSTAHIDQQSQIAVIMTSLKGLEASIEKLRCANNSCR